MGKRSEFERVEKDFYRTTDPRAAVAINPHLKAGTIYAEPCYGQGDLVLSLAENGHSCGWASDIVRPNNVGYTIDCLELTAEHLECVDAIITNPPWSRPVLHAIIEHFVEIIPYAWLLFDADWAHTKQSAPYMEKCTDIVSIGRLIWIPGTTTSGKDNCAWYRFSKDKTGPTRFHGRALQPPRYTTFNSADDDKYDLGQMGRPEE